MWQIVLPFTDASLLLVPQWGEGWHWTGLLALVPFVLVAWLYRYELRLVRRAVAVALLCLRVLVVLVLVLLIGFQPILARPAAEELRGRVLVALDRSESMEVTDPQRGEAEKLRLARSLKLAGDLCPEAVLDHWNRSYQEKGFLQLVGDQESGGGLLEERRGLLSRVCRRVDARTRRQLAGQVLGPDGVGLLDQIGRRHQIEVAGFGREVWEISGATGPTADAAVPPGAATATDLRLPLERALDRSEKEGGPMLGVVLLSDGQHNGPESPVPLAADLGKRGIPVYPIPLGARKPPPDVALVGVKAPPAVFKGADVQVEARLKVTGIPAQEIRVEMKAPGQPAREERLRHDGTDRFYTVRFQTKMDMPGTQSLTVSVPPVTGETRSDNNTRPVVVNVADDKARVLLVDSEARWEYHYLASALARDKAVELRTVVFDQPRVGKISEEELAKVGNPAPAPPAGQDGLAGFDCVILGDASPAEWPLAERTRLEKFVADRGGTLVVVAGKRWMPTAFADNPADPLGKLLPIVGPRVLSSTTALSITLTTEGQQTGFLQMEEGREKNVERWSSFPPPFWAVVGKAKPAAASLAFVPEVTADDKATAKSPPERDRTLIARQNYGFGKVLFVGLDSTWRWRYQAGDKYHHRFWGQILRWAATDKPLVAGNSVLRFGTREPVYSPGREVEVVVRLAEQVSPPAATDPAAARLFRQTAPGKEEAAGLIPLAARADQPRVLEGRTRSLPAGRYAVELEIPHLQDRLKAAQKAEGSDKPLRAEFTISGPESVETSDLETNYPLLEELAAKSGGKVFAPEDSPELVNLLTQRSVRREYRTENRLWQWWPTLAVFLTLLTAEWVVRKWAGLP